MRRAFRLARFVVKYTSPVVGPEPGGDGAGLARPAIRRHVHVSRVAEGAGHLGAERRVQDGCLLSDACAAWAAPTMWALNSPAAAGNGAHLDPFPPETGANWRSHAPTSVMPIVPSSWAIAAPSRPRIRWPRWPASASSSKAATRWMPRSPWARAQRRRAVHVGRGRRSARCRSRAPAGRERHVLDFIGPAPAAADAAGATEDELAGGAKSCAMPGNLGGWLAAHERFGTMPRQRVLAPAIELAENGVPLSWMNVQFFRAGGRDARSLRRSPAPLPRPGQLAARQDRDLQGPRPRHSARWPKAARKSFIAGRSPAPSRARSAKRAAGSRKPTSRRSRPTWRQPLADRLPRVRGVARCRRHSRRSRCSRRSISSRG